MRLLVLFLLLATPAHAGDLPGPIDPGDYQISPEAEVELGQLLFYDPILSGNRTVSCATCHHPRFATSDGLALGIGDGGIGLGPDRRIDTGNAPEQRIPRNSPALFNLGHRSITTLFADGRIEVDADRPSGFRTPLETDMVTGFAGILSAQTMFPVLSPDEMAGHYSENDVSTAVRLGRITGDDGAWQIISRRVADIPDYAEMFAATYPDIAAGRPIAFTDISNAIAAFMGAEWRADDSAFDRHLRGETALTGQAFIGMELFFGAARCGSCHAGPLLSDQAFHAMGAPQIGPGKAARFETHQRDTGRMRVTGQPEDAYAFRTPMLRNVTETGPWGHAGAHRDLRAFLRFHADPKSGLAGFVPDRPLPNQDHFQRDWALMNDPDEVARIAAAISVQPVRLSEEDLDAVMAFLAALRDETSLSGRLGIPTSVPSGLAVEGALAVPSE